MRRSVTARRFSRRWSSTTSDAVIHVRGDLPYGSREYLLLPPHAKDLQQPLASLRAHRNILFGATTTTEEALKEVALPLVTRALEDAGAQGEQPQAVATLHGLCEWVLQQTDIEDTMDKVTHEACMAMATGIPREGHSVVGQGTYRDAQVGWEALARRFAPHAPECQLYRRIPHCELIGIDYLASTEPSYLQSAGGSMARFVFL